MRATIAAMLLFGSAVGAACSTFMPWHQAGMLASEGIRTSDGKLVLLLAVTVGALAIAGGVSDYVRAIGGVSTGIGAFIALVGFLGLVDAGEYAGWGLLAAPGFGASVVVTGLMLLTSQPVSPPAETAAVPSPGGWRPDPSGRHQFHWWSGTGWTRLVSDNGIESAD